MVNHNLFKAAEVRVPLGHIAAGTSNQTGSVVDTYGYDSVAFVVVYGTLTATQVTQAKLQGGNASDGSDATDLANSHTTLLTDGQSGKVQIIDVYRPAQRYLRPVVLRGTANAEILGVLAILYNGEFTPPATLDSSNATAPVFLTLPQPGTA
jgi:hypothetical protein